MSAEAEEPARAVAISQDGLLDGRVRLRQPLAGYRAAIDPVFLAAAVPAGPDESLLDLGCGAGAAALCLLARVPGTRVTGLEIQAELVRLAGENGHENGWSARFLPLTGDVARPPPRLAPGSFHHVLCNPPQLAAGRALPTADPARDLANREGAVPLGDWVATALAMVRSQGTVTFIHRADRLDDLLSAFSGRAGELVVFPLWPGAGKPAKRVILRARKDAATPLRLSPGLVLHQADGGFTPAAETILREAAALDL